MDRMKPPGSGTAIAVVILTAFLMALTILSRVQSGKLGGIDAAGYVLIIILLGFFWWGSRIARWLMTALYAYSGIALLLIGISHGSPWSAGWSFLYFSAAGCLLHPSITEFQRYQRSRGH